MLFMDLDGFKDINDSGGHSTGDVVLQVVADKLLSAQVEGETLIRLGGDEFGVIIENIASPDLAFESAERYCNALKPTGDTSELDETVQISVGVATTDRIDHIADLQTRSNLAMYEAKNQQGSAIVTFEEEFRVAANKSSAMLRALRSANYDEEFFLEYQPVVAIDDHEVLFVEALLRWESPTLGKVSPGEFIPIAERSGEIIKLGRWVLEQASAQIAEWNKNPRATSVAISCNVAIQQLETDDFLEHLADAIKKAGAIEPDQLIIEVTESSATGPRTRARLDGIRSMGHRVAIDDFGSGYSNLANLVHTPFDILKVDGRLLASLEELDETDDNSTEVLSAISAIAGTSGAPVVCEGVEHDHQLQTLLESDISHIQGWLISKSRRADDVQQVIADLHTLPLSA